MNLAGIDLFTEGPTHARRPALPVSRVRSEITGGGGVTREAASLSRDAADIAGMSGGEAQGWWWWRGEGGGGLLSAARGL